MSPTIARRLVRVRLSSGRESVYEVAEATFRAGEDAEFVRRYGKLIATKWPEGWQVSCSASMQGVTAVGWHAATAEQAGALDTAPFVTEAES